MATRDDIYAAIKNADAAGDTESVQKLGAYLQTMPDDAPTAPKPVVANPAGTFLQDAGTQATFGILPKAAALIASAIPGGPKQHTFYNEGLDAYGNNLKLARDNMKASDNANPGSAVAGNVAGAVMAPGKAASTAGRVALNVGQGSLTGMMNADGDTGAKVRAGMIGGGAGLLGSGVEAVAKLGGGILKAGGDAVTRRLSDAGVSLPLGALVPAFKATEDRIRGLPIFGWMANNAAEEARKSFVAADVRRAVKSVGAKIPPNTPPGQATISAAQDALGDAYDSSLKPLVATMDRKFTTGLSQVSQKVADLPDREQQAFGYLMKHEIKPMFDDSGTITGANLQQLKRMLDEKIAGYRSAKGTESLLASPLSDLKTHLFDMVERSDPTNFAAYRAADQAAARLAPVEIAAAKNPATGLYTPAQKLSALRQVDRSARKRATAAGLNDDQSFAADAQSVLGPTMGDSGSGNRVALAALFANPKLLPVAAAANIPYLPGVRQAIQWAATRETPPLLRRGGEELTKIAAPLGRATGLLTASSLTR